MIVRDIFKGKKRYKDYLESAENYPTNILADRLKRLERENIVRKDPYSERPPRYEYTLTKKGLELGKVLEAMYHWGSKNLLGNS